MATKLKPESEESAAPEWTDYRKDLGPKFALRVKRLAEVNAQYKELEAEKKAIGEELKSLMVKIPAEKVMVDGIRVNYISQSQPTLKKELLLEEGVSAEIIEKCTKYTDKTYVTVTPPKEG